jgi:hypothetical protein
MGWFSNIGKKIGSFAKKAYHGAKSVLKTGVGIGNKILNSDIADTVLGFVEPIIGSTPIGAGLVTAVEAGRKGLKIGSAALNTIEKGEKVADSLRGGQIDFGGLIDLGKDVIGQGKQLRDWRNGA